MSTKLEKAAKEAKQRLDERKRVEEAAQLEKFRAATDPFLAGLLEKLEKARKKKEPVQYQVPDGQYRYDQKEERYHTIGASEYLRKTCLDLGLKVKLKVYYDTEGYRTYEWAHLYISE